MAAVIKDKDRGWREIKARLDKLKETAAVTVGIQGDDATAEHAGSGLTNAHLGAIHEFGVDIDRKGPNGPYVIQIPERSFLRATIDEKKNEYADLCEKLSAGIVDRRFTVEQALELLGMRIVADVQNRIAQGIPPPNEPSTIDRKGSSKPLIDTGQLRQAITYVVQKHGTGVAFGAMGSE